MSVPCRLRRLGPRLPGSSPHPFRPGSDLAFPEAHSDLAAWICALSPATPSSVTCASPAPHTGLPCSGRSAHPGWLNE